MLMTLFGRQLTLCRSSQDSGAACTMNILGSPLHIVRFSSHASSLIDTSLIIIRRAASLYLSEAEDPRLASDDPRLAEHAQSDLLWPALNLITCSHPQPFGSG